MSSGPLRGWRTRRGGRRGGAPAGRDTVAGRPAGCSRGGALGGSGASHAGRWSARHRGGPRAAPIAVPPPGAVPRELDKITLPPYVIEAAGPLLIEVVQRTGAGATTRRATTEGRGRQGRSRRTHDRLPVQPIMRAVPGAARRHGRARVLGVGPGRRADARPGGRSDPRSTSSRTHDAAGPRDQAGEHRRDRGRAGVQQQAVLRHHRRRRVRRAGVPVPDHRQRDGARRHRATSTGCRRWPASGTSGSPGAARTRTSRGRSCRWTGSASPSTGITVDELPDHARRPDLREGPAAGHHRHAPWPAIFSPIERMFGITLLGASTVNQITGAEQQRVRQQQRDLTAGRVEAGVRRPTVGGKRVPHGDATMRARRSGAWRGYSGWRRRPRPSLPGQRPYGQPAVGGRYGGGYGCTAAYPQYRAAVGPASRA